MSFEAATKFLERFEREESLRTQLYISKPEDMQQLTEFVRGKGFLVSQEEMAEAIERYQPRYATGSIEPLKQYVKLYRELPAPEAAAHEAAPQLEEEAHNA